MKLPVYLQSEPGACLVSIKAQPRAKSTTIAGLHGTELKVRIAAPPVDSAANEALVEYLAEIVGCGRRQVALARGAASQHKLVRITGVDVELVVRGLKMAGAPV